MVAIKISERTHNWLLRYKEEQGVSYDEIIKGLIEEKEGVPLSMAGSLPDLPAWDREKDRARGRYE